MRQPGLLIESVERQLLDELESVNQDVVALRTELYALHFLAPHYRPHIGLADAHYPILNTLARSVVLEVLPLLAVHPREDFHITLLPGCQQFLRTCILPLQHACLLQHLPQKVKQASGKLPGLDLRVPALLPVRQVDLLHINILCPRAVNIQLCTQGVHYRICLHYPFPQKFRIRRVAHLALVAGRIRIHHAYVFHVRLPGARQYLLLLDLQPVDKF